MERSYIRVYSATIVSRDDAQRWPWDRRWNVKRRSAALEVPEVTLVLCVSIESVTFSSTDYLKGRHHGALNSQPEARSEG